jgi:hypothetical protein
MAASLGITGGHGGTLTEDRIGLIAEISINILVYFALIRFVALISEKWKK